MIDGNNRITAKNEHRRAPVILEKRKSRTRRKPDGNNSRNKAGITLNLGDRPATILTHFGETQTVYKISVFHAPKVAEKRPKNRSKWTYDNPERFATHSVLSKTIWSRNFRLISLLFAPQKKEEKK